MPAVPWLDGEGQVRHTELVPVRMHADEVAVDEDLVRRLLRAQLPHLAAQALSIVEPWGTDNAVWRLGTDLVVRLPRIHWAAKQVAFEATWLPHLALRLPIAVPEPVATGEPAEGYPFPWSVHRWLPGAVARLDDLDDPVAFALDVASTIRALRRIPTEGAPSAGGRARPARDYDQGARQAISGAANLVDSKAALDVWEEALAAAPHDEALVWVHGDLDQNCLVNHGTLSGLIDWSCAGVGDPAADVAVVWSGLFTPGSRTALLEALEVDAATVSRSRGAALGQACAALPYYLNTYPLMVERCRERLAALGVPPRH